MKLLEFEPKGRFVFVGDTHGDLDASKKVVDKYLRKGTKICFLGDYVDRGSKSMENVSYLLSKKREQPTNIYALQGNHERPDLLDFSPSDFWDRLPRKEWKKYCKIFEKFPIAISVGKIIALHGALPDVKNIQEINGIGETFVDSRLFNILWGDFVNEEDADGISEINRPYHGQAYFDRIMKNLGKKVLIRGHQPDTLGGMFDNKCLTVFTSSAYGIERTIAIADFSKKHKIESVEDLVVEEV